MLKNLHQPGLCEDGQISKEQEKIQVCLSAHPPQGIVEKVALASRFLKRKMYEYDALKVEIEALQAEVGEEHGNCQKAQKA